MTETIKLLSNEFGNHAPLTISCGKIHNYLGMILDFSHPGKVVINMETYIANILANLPDEMLGVAMSPAANHLFTVNPYCTKLPTNQADYFHHVVAKLLFLSQQSCPDIQPAVAFLTTRVKEPDDDDWKKLG